jgi:hypothetical protein
LPPPFASSFADAILGAEVFDFGDIDTHFISEECRRGYAPVSAGLIQLPHPVCLLRWHANADAETCGFKLDDDMVLGVRDQDECFEIVLYNVTGAGFCVAGRWSARTGQLEEVASSTACKEFRPPSQCLSRTGLEDAAFQLIGLLMILNTKGIRLERTEPTKSEQRKRRDQGKPPLKRVTHVDVRHYIEACKNADGGGTHASPVPHRRRGHIRQLPTGKQTWVRDCIVNVRNLGEESLEQRSRYKVIHGAQQPLATFDNPGETNSTERGSSSVAIKMTMKTEDSRHGPEHQPAH